MRRRAMPRLHVGRLWRYGQGSQATRLRPAQLVVLAFALAVAVGTGLLALPFASADGRGVPLLTALFTSTSAVCVTGLVVVDTQAAWSPFGKIVIMLLIQAGGFGIMTLSSLAALLVSRRFGLRRRVLTQVETRALGLGDVRRVVRGVAIASLLFESVTAALLAARFWLGHGEEPGRALWLGVFHAVSAFNNAGFALWPDNLERFATDPWISLTIMGAFVAGGIGFPVLFALRQHWRQPDRWSLSTRLTLAGTAVLLVAGSAAVLVLEWSNPATLGRLDPVDRVVTGVFQGATPRTAGFNTVNYGEMREPTLLVTNFLMFVGGGSAGTAGGIKVTTFALLLLMIRAEARGDPGVSVFRRRIPGTVQRQALSVALLGLGAVTTSTMVLVSLTPYDLSEALFESFSAFGTVGLSAGVTGELPGPAQLVLIALMFLGRTGPLTLSAALALKQRDRFYRYPEERPMIG